MANTSKVTAANAMNDAATPVTTTVVPVAPATPVASVTPSVNGLRAVALDRLKGVLIRQGGFFFMQTKSTERGRSWAAFQTMRVDPAAQNDANFDPFASGVTNIAHYNADIVFYQNATLEVRGADGKVITVKDGANNVVTDAVQVAYWALAGLPATTEVIVLGNWGRPHPSKLNAAVMERELHVEKIKLVKAAPKAGTADKLAIPATADYSLASLKAFLGVK